MINNQPLVTVAMPVYNAGKHLRLAVLSILNQSYFNWELLILDDGSTDGSLLDISDINDCRITVISDGINRGLVARLNAAIDLAQGVYFARMDGDDIAYPERLSQQVAALQDNSKIDLIATRAITINEDNLATGFFPYAISHKEICKRPWNGFYFPHPTWMGKIEWFRKYRYSVPAPFRCEDQDLLLRSYRDSRLETLNAVLMAYRIRSVLDRKKLAKTRCAVLFFQLKFFYSCNLWYLIPFSVVSFVVKYFNDFFEIKKNYEAVDNEALVLFDKVLSRLKLPVSSS